MTSSSPQAHDTATALRMAFGPGYGFGGPSDIQFRTIVRSTSVTRKSRTRR